MGSGIWPGIRNALVCGLIVALIGFSLVTGFPVVAATVGAMIGGVVGAAVAHLDGETSGSFRGGRAFKSGLIATVPLMIGAALFSKHMIGELKREASQQAVQAALSPEFQKYCSDTVTIRSSNCPPKAPPLRMAPVVVKAVPPKK